MFYYFRWGVIDMDFMWNYGIVNEEEENTEDLES
jgi:hypothetical protein